MVQRFKEDLPRPREVRDLEDCTRAGLPISEKTDSVNTLVSLMQSTFHLSRAYELEGYELFLAQYAETCFCSRQIINGGWEPRGRGGGVPWRTYKTGGTFHMRDYHRSRCMDMGFRRLIVQDSNPEIVPNNCCSTFLLSDPAYFRPFLCSAYEYSIDT